MSQGSLLRRPLRYRYYNAAMVLIVINVAMFLPMFFSRRLGIQIIQYLGLIPAMVVEQQAWWQVVTYMFLHGGFMHLFFNMLALAMFGMPLERHLGSTEFLLYYFTTGIGAGLATLAVNWYSGMSSIPVVGASGAIFGLLLAFATFFPDTRILFMFFIPMRAPLAVLVFAALELYSMFSAGRSSGVAHMAHLAGLAVGWLYLLVRLGINPLRAFFRRRW